MKFTEFLTFCDLPKSSNNIYTRIRANLRTMESKKSQKDKVKKSSPMMSKSSRVAVGLLSPPVLRHYTKTATPAPSAELSLVDIQLSMDKSFSSLNDKIDKVIGNQNDILKRLSMLEDKQKQFEKSADYLSEAYDKQQIENTRVNNVISELEKNMAHLKSKVSAIETRHRDQIHDLTESQLKAERYSRGFNLRFGGIDEQANENPIEKVKRLIGERLGIDAIIENAHRLGAQKVGVTRHIIAKFLYRPQRVDVIVKARKALQNTPFFVTEDLCSHDFEKKKELRPVMAAAYREGRRPRFRNGNLYINGELYKAPAAH